jgi:hypothetical protein
MKKLLISMLCVAVLLAIAAAPAPLTYLVIGMTQSRWDNTTLRNNVGKVIARVYYNLSTNDTPSAAQITYALSGWTNNYRSKANTNVTVWVFCDSCENLRGSMKSAMTDALLDTVRDRIKQDPQISAGFTRDPASLIDSWGVDPKPSRKP